jgi:ribosomal protein S18 acetylase RimI-like enzyme
MSVKLSPMSDAGFEQYKKHSIEVYAQGMLDQGEYPHFAAARAAACKEVTNFYSTLQSGESSHPFDIKIGEKIVGYLVYSYLIYQGEKIAFVDYIEIFTPFRRKGYAQQAMQLMEQHVKKDDLKIIDLNVMLNKVGAQKLYASLGFEYFRPRYLGPNPEQMTRFDMRKKL